MKIGCVLMAAGLGRRFGENKLTVDLGCGETLINYALSAIPRDKLHRVVVVTQYPQVAALAEKCGIEFSWDTKCLSVFSMIVL